MPLPLIYIAGPFRGATPYDVHRNVCEAESLGLTVARLGGYPVIPHTMTQHFDKQLDDQFWLNGTLELLRVCHAVVATHRWEQSHGAKAEIADATARGIPVFYSELESFAVVFPEWVQAWKYNHRPITLGGYVV